MPRTPTRPWRQWRTATELTTGPSDDVENASRRFLLYGVLPLWFAPAVGDWVMHRRSHIEDTSGLRESLVHALMMAEAGTPVVLGLVAEINPLVLATMGAAALAHGATALWDVTIATGRRDVTPFEQHIHSFLEVLPLTAVAFTACLHWDQVRSLARGGGTRRAWRLSPKPHPLPARYLTGFAVATAALVALPYGEELLRRARAERRRAAP